MRYQDSYMHGGDGPHVVAWLLLVLLLALVVGLVVVLAARWGGLERRSAVPALGGSKPGADAQELVRLRYARGEIDRETFLQVSQDLAGTPPG
jgi:putative membrane protein